MELQEFPYNLSDAAEKFDQEGESVTVDTISNFLKSRLSLAVWENNDPSFRSVNESRYLVSKMLIPDFLSLEENINVLNAAQDLANPEGKAAGIKWFTNEAQYYQVAVNSARSMGSQNLQSLETRLTTLKAALELLKK